MLGILTRPYQPAPYGVDDTSRTRLLKLLDAFDSGRSYNLGMKVLFGRAIPMPGIRLYAVHFVDPNSALDVRKPVNAAVDKFYGKSFAEVMIQLDSTDAPHFLSITRKAIGQQIALVIDNEVYEVSVVQGEISDGRVSLSTLTFDRAHLVAAVLDNGPMPVVFHYLESSR